MILINGLKPARCLLALALMSFLNVAAHAQSTIPLTLAETEDLALASEPGQQALQARAAALNARAVAAGQLPVPTLQLGLNNFPIESGGFSTEGMTNAAVGVRQVFPAGKTRSISAKRFSLLASELNENVVARNRNVLSTVRNVWLEIYYWNQAHRLVSDSRPYFDDLAIVTRSLYAVGRNSQQDVLRAELELSRLDDRLIEIERQRSSAQAALSEWIGLDAVRPIAERFPIWDSVPRHEELRLALQQHPALKASDTQIAARDAGIALAEQRSRPDWSVAVDYSYREGALSPGEPRSDFISLNVTVGLPFFRKQSVDSNLSAALHERTAAEESRQQVMRELQSQLDAEYTDWRDLTRRLALYETRILGLAKDHAEASLLAYQSDRGDFADVMRAYVDDLNTRIDHIRLRVERAQTYAALASLGGIPR